jgi:uncharacterized Tic20 family protein
MCAAFQRAVIRSIPNHPKGILMYDNTDMVMTVVAATLMLDVVLVMLIEAYASTRYFHDFGDTLFRLAIGALIASILTCVSLILLLEWFKSDDSEIDPSTIVRAPSIADSASVPSGETPGSAAGVAAQGYWPKDECRTAMLFHLAGLTVFLFPFLGVLVALGLWVWKRKADAFTAYHVSAMLAFHCVFLVGLLSLMLTLPILLYGWAVAGLVLVGLASYCAYRGRLRSYPGVEKLRAFIQKA